MDINHTEIRVKGRVVSVPSALVDGRTVITTGRWLKTAAIQDEDLVEGENEPPYPESFVRHLKKTGTNR